MRFDAGDKMSKLLFNTLGSLILLATCLGGSQIRAQEKAVSAKVSITRGGGKDGSRVSGSKAPDISNVAVWLVPLDHTDVAVPVSGKLAIPPQMLQRNKTFGPDVLLGPRH